MKKLILVFLLIIPLVNYSQSLTRGEIIDKGLSQIQRISNFYYAT